MNIQTLSLAVIVVTAMFFARPAHAQTPAPTLLEPKRGVLPDTPQNARLVDAVQRGDLTAVQDALRQGASADARTGWEGQPQLTPVTLLAAQGLSDKREKFLPIFHLLIHNVSAPNAADDDTGRTLLMAAVDMDDLDSVKRLVEKGADVNARQTRWPSGGSALLDAVTQGGVKDQTLSPITACLLEHGAAVNVADENGATPLMQAAGMNKTEAVRALLARGADPAARDKHGWTALRYAAMRGWGDVIAVLRDRSPMDLSEAAQFGDAARVRAHLEAGEDPNAPDAQGATPLMAAMKSGSVETARLLLDRGADVNRKRRDGSTALHLAALYGDAPLVGLLLDWGADINAAAPRKAGPPVTPLANAVRQAQADVVALLLKRGADIKHGQGAAALNIAIRDAGNGFVLRPRDVPMSRVPRGDAVYDARGRIIELLLGAGIDVRADHSRALFLAANGGQAGLIELLLNKGADANARGPVGPDGSLDDGQTALMGAIDSWCGAQTDERLLKDGTLSGPDLKDIRENKRFAKRSVELLLAHGADVNRPDARGKTPLMQCVSSGLPALAKMLFARGAEVNAADPEGRTTLMRAAAENDRALVALLLTHHADVNRRDKQGRTALMLAIDDGSNDDYRAYRAARAEDDEALPNRPGTAPPPVPSQELPNPVGHPDIVRLLLRHKAAVNAVAQDGATALSLARRQGFGTVAALLMQAGAKR